MQVNYELVFVPILNSAFKCAFTHLNYSFYRSIIECYKITDKTNFTFSSIDEKVSLHLSLIISHSLPITITRAVALSAPKPTILHAIISSNRSHLANPGITATNRRVSSVCH